MTLESCKGKNWNIEYHLTQNFLPVNPDSAQTLFFIWLWCEVALKYICRTGDGNRSGIAAEVVHQILIDGTMSYESLARQCKTGCWQVAAIDSPKSICP